MSRIIEYWVTTKPIARQIPTNGSVIWSPDGQLFTLTWGQLIQGRVIELQELRRQVIRESHEMLSAFHDIVPGLDISAFKLSKLIDSPESKSVSLFEIKENKEVFQPYIDQVWKHLGKDNPSSQTSIYDAAGKIQSKKAKEFLEKLQRLLQKMLVHFLRTSGISARAWQAASLLYCPYGDYTHNLRLLPQSVPFVGYPQAKQTDLRTYEAYWALAPHLGLALIFDLGVFRRVEIGIMKALRIPTDEHEHFIFVHTHKRPRLSSYVYDGRKVNECLLVNTTPELAYGARALRNVHQAMVDKHFSRLHDDAVRSMLASASNDQAQHTSNTHDTRYALDEISQGTGIPMSKRDRQLAVSGAFHAYFGFGLRSVDWDRYANYQPSEDVEINKVLALDLARRLIVEYYLVAEGSTSKRLQRLKDLLRDRPFLLGEQASSIIRRINDKSDYISLSTDRACLLIIAGSPLVTEFSAKLCLHLFTVRSGRGSFHLHHWADTW